MVKKTKIGYRTEQLYGEGYRDAASVMAHEVFELQNTDILETLEDKFFKNTDIGKKLIRLAEIISYEDEPSLREDEFLDQAYEDGRVGIKYFTDILSEIEKITGKNIRYVLWLCDSMEDIKNNYTISDSDERFTEFDEYAVSDIILSDCGPDGKLYGYEELPEIIKTIYKD